MGSEIPVCRYVCGKEEITTAHLEEPSPHNNENDNPNNKTNKIFRSASSYDNQSNSQTISNPMPNQLSLKNYVTQKGNSANQPATPVEPSQLTLKNLPNTNNSNTKIISIQSVYRGFKFRKEYPLMKQSQVEETNQLIAEINELYNKHNLIQAESQHNEKFSVHSWNKFYTVDETTNDIPQEILQELENNKLTNEKVYDTKILLPKDKKGFFYKGKVNINNVPYGYGVLLRHDGMKAEGNWNNYILTGWSRLIEVDGTLSEGFFIKNKLQGKGIQKTLNGVMYIGTFVNGIKEGEGVEESNEYKYEGMFQNGKKNGLGRIEYKILQDVYEGEFLDNNITGNGHYVWSNKDTYQGELLNGKMHGKGLYKWPDGGEYYGEYVNNVKQGKGIFKWANGKVFEGPFFKGRPNGIGILKMGECEVEVEFQEGKLITDIKDVLKREIEKKKRSNTYDSDT
jgi:hypothetical protein